MWVLKKPWTKVRNLKKKMERLTAELLEQFRKSEELEMNIKENLAGLGYKV
jgi:NTP pyrophosphatase (non-canonical NTP hydrolase)